MQRIKNLLTFFIGYPLTIIAFIFIGKVFYDHKDSFLNNSFNLTLFIIGVLFQLLFFILKSVSWLRISKHEGSFISPLLAYSTSELKRYVPGNIFGFVARVNAFSNEKTPKRIVVKRIGIEAFLLGVSALTISIPAILYYFNIRLEAVLIITFLFVFLSILYLKETNLRLLVLFKKYFSSFVILSVGWIFYGIGNFFIATSLITVDPSDFILFISLFTLSWLFGYLVFVTPMGLGAREIAVVFFFSRYFGEVVASVVSIISRLSMILAEVLFVILLYILSKKPFKFNIEKLDWYKCILFLAVVSFSIYYSVFTILRHNTFLSGRFDLGNMTQVVWSTSKGNILELTNPDGVNQIVRLGVHFDPILAFFAPLYWLYSSPEVLLVIQAFVNGIGAFFVYGLSRFFIKNKLISLLLSISYLFNFWVGEQVIFDFHSVSLATTFLLAFLYFFFKKQKIAYIVFLILALLTKENVFLVTFALGVLLCFQKQLKLGLVLSITSLLAFIFIMTSVIPYFRSDNHFAISYLSYLGFSVQEITFNFLTKPHLVIPVIFRLQTLDYVFRLFLPTGFLPLLSPSYLIPIIPELILNTLSLNPNLRSHEYHYGALFIPFMYLSSIFGIKKLLNFGVTTKAISLYLIVVTIITVYSYSPLPFSKRADVAPFNQDATRVNQIKEYLGSIKDSDSVAATNNIGAHISHREKIYVLPFGLNQADVMVFYKERMPLLNEVDLNLYDIKVYDNDFFIFERK